MNGDIFVDSPNIIITSNKLTANLNGQGSFVKNSELQFNEAKFEGNVKMFDKINNTNIYAQKVTINYKKKLAILEGHAKIERLGNVATGSTLMYDLGSGIANLKSNGNTRVKLLITY
jgi:lipopolysaccharide export system protein LptA